MALWGNRDQNSDAPKFVADARNGRTGRQQFGNTTVSAGQTVGVFGVDPAEARVKKQTHAGWVKVTTGSGGRAGRVHMETLVAMGSIATDATSFTNTATTAVANTTGTADDSVFPDV